MVTVTIELPESWACQIHFSADASSGESVYCIGHVIADRTVLFAAVTYYLKIDFIML